MLGPTEPAISISFREQRGRNTAAHTGGSHQLQHHAGRQHFQE